MSRNWTVIRIPADLADRIERMSSEMMQAHVSGRSTLPTEYCEHIPPHHVITRAVAEMEARRQRSRRSRRKRRVT